MTKVIMNGCNGKMGQTITEICKADADIKIVAGIDLYDGIDNDYPVFSSIDKCDVDADVVIDFSNAKAVDGSTGLLRGQAGSGCFMHYRS